MSGAVPEGAERQSRRASQGSSAARVGVRHYFRQDAYSHPERRGARATVDRSAAAQTYQAALKGSKMADPRRLKMIEKREIALAKTTARSSQKPMSFRSEHDPTNADEAMLLLGITVRDPNWTEPCEYGVRMKLATWAVQAGLSRPGRRGLEKKEVEGIEPRDAGCGSIEMAAGTAP